MRAKQMKKTQRTSRRFLLLLAQRFAFVLGLVVGPTAIAQPAPQPQTPSEADASGDGPPSADDRSSDTTTANTGSQRRKGGDKGGVFRPSEDISEDIAITFPVDI